MAPWARKGLLVLALVAAISGMSNPAAAGVQGTVGGPRSAASSSKTSIASDALPPWSEGYLYIHHISTGRGNAAYMVMPDGTTLLIDAGETDQDFIKSVAPLKAFLPRPDAEHGAGYWIADYIRTFAPRGRPATLDYALITHFHTDHMGMLLPSSPMSVTGAYQLTGITEVADLVPIANLVDRAAPTYKVPVDLRTCDESSSEKTLANYLKMADYRQQHGQTNLGLQAGALDQIQLKKPKQYPDFHIRNVASSGVIWTGRGEKTQQYIPTDAVKDCHFDENPFSNVIRLSYGKFSYYSGGDIPGVPDYTQPYWRDMETPVAAVVGPVSVMTLDHHGNRDTVNGAILRALRPRVIIQQNWLSAQPGEEVVVRMASHEFYPGPRDVFATGMSPETRSAIGPIMDRIYRSFEGHVVLRVAPGGASYEVFILADADPSRRITNRFGPYQTD